MQGSVIVAVVLFSSNLAHAWDAVAVFRQPEKIVVQINEPYPSERLEILLATTEGAESWSYLAEDTRFKAQCQRGSLGITCMFRFLPDTDTLFAINDVLATAPLSLPANTELRFLNSNGDHFTITADGESAQFKAGKK